MKDFAPDALLAEVNTQANLIALCPNHHWEFDHGRLNLSSVGFPEFDRLHPAGFPAGALELKKSVALSS